MSNSMLPVNFESTKSTGSQNVSENDEVASSAMDNDRALTAGDSEKEVDSDSTVMNETSRESWNYIFEVKDEVLDSDEDEKSIPTLPRIKQEPVDDQEIENGTYNSDLYLKVNNTDYNCLNNDMLPTSGCESETFTENSLTPNRSTKSPFLITNQKSENSCNNSEMNAFKVNEANIFSVIKTIKSEPTEDENDAYLYGSEAENTDVAISHNNSANPDSGAQCPSAVPKCNDVVSEKYNSQLQMKTTVDSCVVPKEKEATDFCPEFFTRVSAASVSASQKNQMHHDYEMTPPSKKCPASNSARINSDKHRLPRDLIDFSNKYLNFSKSDIDECLNFVNSMKSGKPVNPMLNFSDQITLTSSEEANCSHSVTPEVTNPIDSMAVAESSTMDVENDLEQSYPEVLPSDNNSYSFDHLMAEVLRETSKMSTSHENISCETVCKLRSPTDNHSTRTSGIRDVKEYSMNISRGKLDSMAVIESSTLDVENSVEKSPLEVSSSENDDNSYRFDRLMAEVLREASKMNIFSQNISCRPVCNLRSSTENYSILTPGIQNKDHSTNIKQEKIYPMSVTESTTMDVENSLENPYLGVPFSQDNNNSYGLHGTMLSEDKASEMNTFPENTFFKAVYNIQSFAENDSTLTPGMQNADEHSIKVKQEKNDSTTVTELPTMNMENSLKKSCPEIQSSQDNTYKSDRKIAEVFCEASEMATPPENLSYKAVCNIRSSTADHSIQTPGMQNNEYHSINIKQEKNYSMAVTESAKIAVENSLEKCYPEVLSSQDNNNSHKFGSTIIEDFHKTSEINKFCKSACDIRSSTKNYCTLTPHYQNEDEHSIYVKQEEINLMKVTKSPATDMENCLEHCCQKLFTGENNASSLPSIEDLQNIIKTSALFDKSLSPSEIKLNASKFLSEDVNVKIEQPDVEEITLDEDLAVSSDVRPTHSPDVVAADEDVKVLVIKKKSNDNKKTPNRQYDFLTNKRKRKSQQRTVNFSTTPFGFDVNAAGNTAKKIRNIRSSDNFADVEISRKSDTFKTAVRFHGLKTAAKVSSSQLNIDSTVHETNPNNIYTNIVVKIENTNYSNPASHTDSSDDYEKKNVGASSVLPKRTICIPKQQDASLNSCKEQKQNVLPENEPLVKRMKNTPVTHEENAISVPSSSFTCSETDNLNFSCKRKGNEDFQETKKKKSDEKHAKISFLNCDPVVAAASVSESNGQKPSKLMNEISSSDVNIQSTKQIDNYQIEFQPTPATSSDQNFTSENVSSTNTCYQHLSKLGNESKAIAHQICPHPEKYQSKFIPLSLERRGKGRISISKSVGINFINTNDFPSLILEWNANWLLVQRENKKCAPICEATYVKNFYENELDYYNTYFPLHLLSIWLKIYESWKKCPPCFDTMFENQFEKKSFVKISLSAVLDTENFQYWPKREDIVLCSSVKHDGSKEKLFGRICSVMAKEYIPPADSFLADKAPTLKKVKIELFCAELLNVPRSKIVQVQILSNMRIALLQNDALQNLNGSMKDIILDPKKCIPQWKFIALSPSSETFAFETSLKNIYQSVISPQLRITVVDTPTSADGILAITHLAKGFVTGHIPALIALKTEDFFLELAYSMRNLNFKPILAIKRREINLPEDLRSLMLEERAAMSPDIFEGRYLILTLLSSVFLGDFTSAFANQNLTCVVHEAHLCTEAETALLLYYDVKKLVLFGNQEEETHTTALLNTYGYHISLFQRFCRAMPMYDASL